MTLSILMWAPISTPEGGHKIQFRKTAAALEATGSAKVVSCHDAHPTFEGFDVVHAFELTPDQARLVRLSGRPLVISPIYWAKEYRVGGPRPRPVRRELRLRVRNTAGLAIAGLAGHHHEKAEELTSWSTETRALYEIADLLLPNSLLEAQAIQDDLRVTTPSHVVPNAVDPHLFMGDGTSERIGVVMVGRFEPHKNQLNLIRACNSLDIPLTLVGPRHPHHQAYYDECRRRRGPRTVILPPQPHEALVEVYRAARVHALPSYFETTGLVSLEAALAGCTIVTTSRGYAREYFRDEAEYCEPHDVRSIAGAVSRALLRAPSADLQSRIIDQYSWERTAEATLAGYERAIRRAG